MLSDEALLAGVAGSDPNAMHAFVDRFKHRVHGVSMAILRDRTLAEEVTQDAFTKAWRHADGFDPRRGSVAGWLMRITHNAAIDAVRVRRPEPVELEMFTRLVDPTPDPETAVGEAAEIRRLLAQLPVEQARALLLAAIYGHTASEIAEMDGIPLGTAKTRLRLGMAKLHALLDPPAREAAHDADHV